MLLIIAFSLASFSLFFVMSQQEGSNDLETTVSAFWFIINLLLAVGLFLEGSIVVYMLKKLQIS
jgi:hypothetical protein